MATPTSTARGMQVFFLLEIQSQLSCEQQPQPDVEEEGVKAEVVFLFGLNPVLQLALIFKVKPGSIYFSKSVENFQVLVEIYIFVVEKHFA